MTTGGRLPRPLPEVPRAMPDPPAFGKSSVTGGVAWKSFGPENDSKSIVVA